MRNKKGVALVLLWRWAIQVSDAFMAWEKLRQLIQSSFLFPKCFPCSNPPCTVKQCCLMLAAVWQQTFKAFRGKCLLLCRTGPEMWSVSRGLNGVSHKRACLMPWVAQCHRWVPDVEGQTCPWLLANIFLCVFYIQRHKSEESRAEAPLAQV